MQSLPPFSAHWLWNAHIVYLGNQADAPVPSFAKRKLTSKLSNAMTHSLPALHRANLCEIEQAEEQAKKMEEKG